MRFPLQGVDLCKNQLGVETLSLLSYSLSSMADIVRQKTLKVYATEDGKEPYTDWLESLKDYVIRSRIIRRIEHNSCRAITGIASQLAQACKK